MASHLKDILTVAQVGAQQDTVSQVRVKEERTRQLDQYSPVVINTAETLLPRLNDSMSPV